MPSTPSTTPNGRAPARVPFVIRIGEPHLVYYIRETVAVELDFLFLSIEYAMTNSCRGTIRREKERPMEL